MPKEKVITNAKRQIVIQNDCNLKKRTNKQKYEPTPRKGKKFTD